MKKYLLTIIIALSFGCKKETQEISNTSNTPTGKPALQQNSENIYDVVVYGGTAGGVMAAIQASRMGKSVVLISNVSRLGGMTTGGLSNTDIGISEAVGGIALEFYTKVQQAGGRKSTDFTFEPKIALSVINNMLNSVGVTVLSNERLARPNGVIKIGTTIQYIELESGKRVQGKTFIDSSYEGDLMADAGVSYIVGREANSKYVETHNGVRDSWDINVSPFIIENDESSGLLPNVLTKSTAAVGSADDGVQPYNFRLIMTKNAANRLMVAKSDDYDPLKYEVLVRFLKKNPSVTDVLTVIPIGNDKYDVNNGGLGSTDYVNKSREYAEASYLKREQIKKDHEAYIRGLIWTIQNDNRIPLVVKSKYAELGLAKDEFVENANWPTELYIRESRRLIGEEVMTQTVVSGTARPKNPIGMGSYPMDSHAIQIYYDPAAKKFRGEGSVFLTVSKPYAISYLSLVPKKAECSNLFVICCPSASHIAFGSIRMEPQFMIFGQAAATAASLSIDNHVAVQDVNYELLKARLTADKQVIAN